MGKLEGKDKARKRKNKKQEKKERQRLKMIDESKRIGNAKSEDPHLVFSFKDFDDSQAVSQSFNDWQDVGLSGLCKTQLKYYSEKTLTEAINENPNFVIYGEFPPDDKTDFTRPNHTPEGAQWGRIRVMGRPRIVFHIVGNVLYIVFFDKDHKFWKVEQD